VIFLKAGSCKFSQKKPAILFKISLEMSEFMLYNLSVLLFAPAAARAGGGA
jgi:hypothetical protein